MRFPIETNFATNPNCRAEGEVFMFADIRQSAGLVTVL